MNRRGCAVRIAAAICIASMVTGIGTHATAAATRSAAPASTAPDIAATAATAPIPTGTQIERGRYLAALGDCEPCHTSDNGHPYAGARPLDTPFGTLYSANITPDHDTGIGTWSADDFYRAMHEGRDNHGNRLYPAFPYPWFTRMPRADVDALFAYLRTLPAVSQTRPQNKLPFPLSYRPLVGLWNLLFFDAGDFMPRPDQSAQWNRGAYLVTGPGHCGACHTPKNMFGADRSGRELAGGTLSDWHADNLTPDVRTGLGAWTEDDIVQFLHTGRNARATASGAMQEVIDYSTSQMNDADLHAIAVYLRSVAVQTGNATATPPGAASLSAGSAIFRDQCAACHLSNARGVPTQFPPLPGNAALQADDATTLIRIMLEGTVSPPTQALPTPLAMPSFAWKLDDQQVADVLNYARNSWGNHAAAIHARDVSKLRDRMAAHPPPRQ